MGLTALSGPLRWGGTATRTDVCPSWLSWYHLKESPWFLWGGEPTRLFYVKWRGVGTWPLGFCPASRFREFRMKWWGGRNFLLYLRSCVELLPHWNRWVTEGFWNGPWNPSPYSSLMRPPQGRCLLLIEMIGQELGTSSSLPMSCEPGVCGEKAFSQVFAFRCYLAMACFLPLQCRNLCQLRPSPLCPNTPVWCVSMSHIFWICQKCFHQWKRVWYHIINFFAAWIKFCSQMWRVRR